MTAVRNVTAIVHKEWRHYFGSPIAYVALFPSFLAYLCFNRGVELNSQFANKAPV